MKTKNHGFTLVELMVAIVISLVAVLAATEVYVSTRQTNRLQGMQSRLSEDGRFAVFMLQRLLSQAGFRPTPSIALPDEPIAVADDDDDDVITLRFMPDGANQIACDGSVLPLSTVFQAFEIRRSEDGLSLRCSPLGAGSGSTANWIAPAAEGVAGNGTEAASFAVWPGIDDSGPTGISADFGCGTGRDCIVDRYADELPAGVTSNQIKAVRVCLVLRSEAIDGSVVKPKGVPTCAEVLANRANAADADVISGSQNDRKLYRTFVTTVLMKNLKDN